MMDFQHIANLDRMIACVGREVGFRETVFPGLPGRPMMTHEQARREIDTMRDVLEFLQARAPHSVYGAAMTDAPLGHLRAARAPDGSFWQPPEAPEAPDRPGRRVLRTVADVFGVAEGRILSPRRDAPAAAARQAVCYVLRELLGWTLPQIGQFLKRDHTTVLHGCRVVRRRLGSDPDFAVRVRDVLARVGGG